MEGMVLHFDVSGNRGLIKDKGGERYEFSASDWKSESTPLAGMHADFTVDDGAATEVYELPLSTSKVTSPSQEPAHSSTGKLYGSRKMNWTGILATLAVLVTLYLPLLYTDSYGAVTPFRMSEPFSLTYGLHLSIILSLVLILIFFYGGARKATIRILVVLALAGIGFHYFFAFQQLAIVWDGEPIAVSLIGGAYLNFAACGLLLLAAFNKHYSRLGAVSSGTSVVKGCIDTTGTYKNIPGGCEYSHLKFSDESGETFMAKRVALTEDLAAIVSPGVCGIFVFTKGFFGKNLKGVKTDNYEAYEPPGNIAFIMFKSLLGAGLMAFLTYGAIFTILLIPIAPIFALIALLCTWNILSAPFKVRHVRKTLKNWGFSLTKVKEI